MEVAERDKDERRVSGQCDYCGWPDRECVCIDGPFEMRSKGQTELQKALRRWLEAKREQILREDTRGELIAEVKRQERDVEDAITQELESQMKGQQ